MELVKAFGSLSDRMTTQLLLQHSDRDAFDLAHDRQGVVRKAQINAIMSTSEPMMLANILNVTALVSLESHVGKLTGLTLAWAGLVVCFAIYGLLGARRFRRSKARETASQRAPGKIAVSSALLAIVWCYPLIVLLPNGELLQVAFHTALVAGMIAGGALALYPVPLAGILYISILSITTFAVLLTQNVLPALPFGIVTAAFSFVVVYSAYRHTSMFLSELLGKLQAERQRDVVGLLLDTFQGAGGQYLWRSDQQLNLKTDPAVLCQMLDVALPDNGHANLLDILKMSDAPALNSDFDEKAVALAPISNGTPRSNEVTLRTKGNRVIRLASRLDSGDSLATSGFHGYVKDVTSEATANEKILHLATHDVMTGLLNTAALNTRAHAKLKDTDFSKDRVLLIYADADNLKTINDNFGHAAGDALIKALAERIAESLGPDALVARRGGDEFIALAILVRDIDVPTWADETLARINGHFCYEHAKIPLSCCLGISCANFRDTTIRGLELEADRALYTAKSIGKGKISIYDAAMGIEIHRDRLLATDIVAAIEQGELKVALQPIVDLKSNAIAGAEALVRWNHPKLGPISPEKTVTIALAEGLGPALLDHMIRTASRHARMWPTDSFLTVNMSSADLQLKSLEKRVADILRGTGFPPERLFLEITETRLLLDSDEVQNNLSALRAQGIKIAIDDFGSGYSSLSYISRYPSEMLKIDKSLIENLDTDPTSQIIIDALQKLSKTTGVLMVAEGVETSATLDRLRNADVALVQGYALHRPMTPASLLQLLAQQHRDKTRTPNLRYLPAQGGM